MSCPGLRAEKPARAHATCECRARLAADDERARIVAWLRECEAVASNEGAHYLTNVADMIEDGTAFLGRKGESS